jgi:hypothetical protein
MNFRVGPPHPLGISMLALERQQCCHPFLVVATFAKRKPLGAQARRTEGARGSLRQSAIWQHVFRDGATIDPSRRG